jgi:hypothetical protein
MISFPFPRRQTVAAGCRLSLAFQGTTEEKTITELSEPSEMIINVLQPYVFLYSELRITPQNMNDMQDITGRNDLTKHSALYT